MRFRSKEQGRRVKLTETETLTSQAKHFESSWFNTNYKAIRFPAKDEENVSSVTQITSLILCMNVPAISIRFFRFTFVRLTYMAILLLLAALLARFSTHRSKHDESVSTCPGVKSKRYRGGNFGVFGFSACTFLLLCIHAWLYVNYLVFRRKTDEQRCELNVITFVIIFTLLRWEKIFRLNCPGWRCIR